MVPRWRGEKIMKTADTKATERELQDDELDAVVGGSSAISEVIKALGDALQSGGRDGGGGVYFGTNGVRGKGGQIGP
jgi:hypothetical protein